MERLTFPAELCRSRVKSDRDPLASKPLQNSGPRNAFESGEGCKVTSSTETQDIISVKDLMLKEKQGVGFFVCWLELSLVRWGSGTGEKVFTPRNCKVNAMGNFLFMAHVKTTTDGSLKGNMSCFLILLFHIEIIQLGSLQSGTAIQYFEL